MRGLKSTIALTVVLGGLAAYIYFVTSKMPDGPASTLEKVFSGVQSDKIEGDRIYRIVAGKPSKAKPEPEDADRHAA